MAIYQEVKFNLDNFKTSEPLSVVIGNRNYKIFLTVGGLISIFEEDVITSGSIQGGFLYPYYSQLIDGRTFFIGKVVTNEDGVTASFVNTNLAWDYNLFQTEFFLYYIDEEV